MEAIWAKPMDEWRGEGEHLGLGRHPGITGKGPESGTEMGQGAVKVSWAGSGGALCRWDGQRWRGGKVEQAEDQAEQERGL